MNQNNLSCEDSDVSTNPGNASPGSGDDSGTSSEGHPSCVDNSVSPSVSSLLSQAEKSATDSVHAEEEHLEKETELRQGMKQGGFVKSAGRGSKDPLALEQAVAPAIPVPFVGLINEGCTCYLNSLLQMLFHLCYFRNAVYLTPTDANDESCSIPRALQSVFHEMEVRRTPVHTKKLTAAFDWTESELYSQHDIQEMATLLRDNLEERMKGSVSEGAINRMFEGYGEQVVATLDKSFCSRSRDTFYDIHLPLEGHTNLMDSLRSLTAKDMLVGDNKYRVEEPGREPQYKDAQKSYEFRRFPPVIWFHLKRFEMDLTSPILETKKVNSYLEFPVELSLEELEHETPSNWGEYATQVFAGDMGDEKKMTGDDGGEKRKRRKGDNEAATAIARPFSRDTPAVYDLQGVIVHKGSVRSGHYYCYIREWDATEKRFTRWLEFDDERVTVVSQEVAVNDNFGVPAPTEGRPLWHMPTNNAYMLSYVRRADCQRMFERPKNNIVPQCVRDQLREEIQEEKRREEEANMRRRKLVLYVLTDEIISEHVKRVQRETFPSDPRIWEEVCFRVEVEKTTPLQMVYVSVAECVPNVKKRFRFDDFRLWLSPWTSHIHVAVPLQLTESTKNCSLTEYLNYRNDDKSPLMHFLVYLQRRTTLPQLYVPNTASLFVNQRLGAEAVAACNGCAIVLPKPTPISSITFYTIYFSDYAAPCNVHICLYAADDQKTPCESKTCTLSRDLCMFDVNSTGQKIALIRCAVRGSLAWVYLLAKERPSMSSLRVTYGSEGEGIEETNISSLPRIDRCAVLVFLKYFNPVTRHVAYAGSAMIPLHATVADCGRVLLRLLGEDPDLVDTLRIYEESQCQNVLLDNEKTLQNSGIIVGSVLIAQQRNSRVHSYTDVNDYLLSLPNFIHVKATHSVFEERYMFSEEDLGYEADNVEGSDDCVVPARPAVVEASIPMSDADSEVRGQTTFYPPRNFHVIKAYMLTLDSQLKYDEVCEAIGTASGHDPAFIRLYKGTCGGNPNCGEILTPEVDPAPSDMVLSGLLWGNRVDVIFFEVLREPRRVVECRPRLVVTVRGRKNEAIYKEKLVVPQGTTVGDVVEQAVRRCAITVERTFCSDGGAGAALDAGGSVNRCSRSRSNNSEVMSSQVITPFVIAPHYLALVVDPRERLINCIIEVPVMEDGTCDCNCFIDDLVSQAVAAYGTAGLCAPMEPLTIFVVPAPPLQKDQFRIACCHGEVFADRDDSLPLMFGQPFVVTADYHATVETLRDILLEYTGVPANEVVPLQRGVVVIATRRSVFLPWSECFFEFVRREERKRGPFTPSLLLNHRRPREKPGSRYVAQAAPALRISRR